MINPGPAAEGASRLCCRSPTQPEEPEMGDPHHPHRLQPRWGMVRRLGKPSVVLQEKGRTQPSGNELSIPGQEEVSRQEDKV